MGHISIENTILPTLGLQTAAIKGTEALTELNSIFADHGGSTALRATDAANAMVEQLVSELGYDDATLDQTEIARSLPPELRTNHWYCDLHHSMFLILLSRADQALTEGRRPLAENYIDTLTIYWILHSLMEEEGMALQIQTDPSRRQHASDHAKAHVMITRWWRAQVLDPFKNGTASDDQTRRALRAFFKRVVSHIATMDQETYGTRSTLDERAISREVAHIATCGLPLSPFMPGCTDMLRSLAPRMRGSLSASALTPLAKEPLKPLALVSMAEPLWDDGKGAFRDIFTRQHRSPSMRAA
jgi:hypothetical protein